MNKFVKKILKLFFLFVLVRFLFYLFIAYSTNYTYRFLNLTYKGIATWGNSYERSLDYITWKSKKSNLPKGIILGSSTAYRNINTDVLTKQTNINWFNLGSSSQTSEVSSIILRKIIHSSDIKYVIIDIYGELSEKNSYESIFDLINNSRLSIDDKLKLFYIDPNPKLLDIMFYREIEQWISKKTLRTPSSSNGIYFRNGTTYSPNKSNELKQRSTIINSLEIRENKHFQDIINYCNENELKLLINIAPILQTKHCVKIDFPNVIKNDELRTFQSLFYDSHHMTAEGAIQYSKLLGNKINLIKSSKSNHTHQGSN
ncbi:MAG: hypothetical protein ACOVJ8_10170 [Sediminibacterium sp.]